MTTPEGIELTPAPYDEVVALLKSETLRAVEEPIAAAAGLNILYDLGPQLVASTQAEISVSGMSPSDLQRYLTENGDAVVRFATRFIEWGKTSTSAADQSQEEKPLGILNGIGISRAIQHNFLANRAREELIAFLNNRHIPRVTTEANVLQEVFDNLANESWQPPHELTDDPPITHEDLRDLFEHLDRKSMGGYACDGKFTLTEKFLQSRALPVEDTLGWLGENGAGCDCEIMLNVAQDWEDIIGYTPPYANNAQ